jgi:hypothetical protein
MSAPGLSKEEIREKARAASTALFDLEKALGPSGSELRQRVYRMRIEVGVLTQQALQQTDDKR